MSGAGWTVPVPFLFLGFGGVLVLAVTNEHAVRVAHLLRVRVAVLVTIGVTMVPLSSGPVDSASRSSRGPNATRLPSVAGDLLGPQLDASLLRVS